jgi:hypothetical protein
MGSELELTGGPFYDIKKQNRDLYIRLHKAVKEWRSAYYSASGTHLVMMESLFGLMISLSNRYLALAVDAAGSNTGSN